LTKLGRPRRSSESKLSSQENGRSRTFVGRASLWTWPAAKVDTMINLFFDFLEQGQTNMRSQRAKRRHLGSTGWRKGRDQYCLWFSLSGSLLLITLVSAACFSSAKADCQVVPIPVRPESFLLEFTAAMSEAVASDWRPDWLTPLGQMFKTAGSSIKIVINGTDNEISEVRLLLPETSDTELARLKAAAAFVASRFSAKTPEQWSNQIDLGIARVMRTRKTYGFMRGTTEFVIFSPDRQREALLILVSNSGCN
jgi:hypothetical protein